MCIVERHSIIKPSNKMNVFRNYLRQTLENCDSICYNILCIIIFRRNSNNTGGFLMAISYNKLWKLLIDKKMSQADLRRAAEIAPNTMTKLRRDEPVNLAILGRACEVLECDIGDIMEFIPEDSNN